MLSGFYFNSIVLVCLFRFCFFVIFEVLCAFFALFSFVYLRNLWYLCSLLCLILFSFIFLLYLWYIYVNFFARKKKRKKEMRCSIAATALLFVFVTT